MDNRIKAYMDEWGYSAVPNEEDIVYDDSFGYISIEDIKQFIQAEDEMNEFESGLYELLTDRGCFEHDVNNEVVTTFKDALINHWYINDEWEDMVKVLIRVEDGKYDDEMNRYYAYLQAESLLGNLDLLDFNDEDNIEESLSINNIFVYDDDLMYRLPGVIETVERTIDLGVDVKRLLLKVINSLKNTGKTIDFTVGY